MEQFIARENIRRFQEQRAAFPDEGKAASLRKFLAEEEVHLANPEQNIRGAPSAPEGLQATRLLLEFVG